MKKYLTAYLLVFSSSFMETAFAQVSFKMAHASFVANTPPGVSPGTSIPNPIITRNLSTPYWEGREYHYKFVDFETGVHEEFSVHVIDKAVAKDDPDYLLSPPISNTTTDLSEVGQRDIGTWACKHVTGCVDQVAYAAAVSAAQITAVASTMADRLRADNYKLAKSIAGGFIQQFSMGIFTNVVSWYITNKIQAQAPQTTDTCNTQNLENMIASLQNDIRILGQEIQAARSQPRKFDYYADNAQAEVEGEHLAHTVKPTQNPNDYKNIAC